MNTITYNISLTLGARIELAKLMTKILPKQNFNIRNETQKLFISPYTYKGPFKHKMTHITVEPE